MSFIAPENKPKTDSTPPTKIGGFVAPENKTNEITPTVETPPATKPIEKSDYTPLFDTYFKQFGGKDLGGDNVTDILATQKAYQKLKTDIDYVNAPTTTSDDIAKQAVDNINNVRNKWKGVKQSVDFSTFNSEPNDYGVANPIIQKENTLKDIDAQENEELNSLKDFYTLGRMKKVGIGYSEQAQTDPKYLDDVLKNINSKDLINTDIELSNVGNLPKERALKLGNSSMYAAFNPILSPIDRQNMLVNGASFQAKTLEQSNEFEKSFQKNISESIKQANQYFGDNISKENQDYLNTLNDQLTQSIQRQLKKTQIIDKINTIVGAEAPDYKEYQENIQKQNINLLTPDIISPTHSNLVQSAKSTLSKVFGDELFSGGIAIAERLNDLSQGYFAYDHRPRLTDEQLQLKDVEISSQRNQFRSQIGLPLLEDKTALLNSQLTGFDKKDKFFFNPELLLYNIGKTTIESSLMGTPAAAFDSKIMQGLAMAVPTNMMFADDIIHSEYNKGLSPRLATSIGLIRSQIEVASEMINPIEIGISKGLIRGGIQEGEKLAAKEAQEIAFRNTIREITGTSKWDRIATSLLNAKVFAKEFAKQSSMEYVEEFVSDVANKVPDFIAKHKNPDYQTEDNLNFQSQLTSFLTVAATMIPMAGYAANSHVNATINSARMQLGATPQVFLDNLNQQLSTQSINKAEYDKRLQILNESTVSYAASKGFFDEIDKKDVGEAEKASEKATIFQSQFSLAALQNELKQPLTNDRKEEIFDNITKISEFLANKYQEIVAPITPEEQEQKRVKETEDFLSLEFGDKYLSAFKNKEKLLNFKEDFQNAVQWETSEKIKELYQDKLNLVNDRLQTIDTKEEDKPLSFIDEISSYPTEEQISILTNKMVELEEKGEDSKDISNRLKELHSQKEEENSPKYLKKKGDDTLWEIVDTLPDGKIQLATRTKDGKIDRTAILHSKEDIEGEVFNQQEYFKKLSEKNKPKEEVKKEETPEEEFRPKEELEALFGKQQPSPEEIEIQREEIQKRREQEIRDATDKWATDLDENAQPKGELPPIIDAINEKYDNELKSVGLPTQEDLIKIEDSNKEQGKEENKKVDEQAKRIAKKFNPLSTVPQETKKENEGDPIVETQVATFRKLFLKNKDLSYEDQGIYATVVNGSDTPNEYHRKATLNALTNKVISQADIDKGRIVALTDKEGNFLYFDREGNPSTKEAGGLIVHQNLTGKLEDGKLVYKNQLSGEEQKKYGLEVIYPERLAQLEALRKSKEKLTFTISRISEGQLKYSSTPIPVKTLGLIPEEYEFQPQSGGRTAITLQNSQEVIPIHDPFINTIPNLANSLAAILDISNNEGLPESLQSKGKDQGLAFQERTRFVENFIYTFGSENTKTGTRRRFRISPTGKVFISVSDGITNTTVNQKEIPGFINSLQLRISKELLSTQNEDFEFFNWDGTKFTPFKQTYKAFISKYALTPLESPTPTDSYLELGIPITPEISKIEIKESPKEEIKPSLEQPQKTTKPKIEKKSTGKKKGGLSDLDTTPLDRLKTLKSKPTTPEQEQKAEEWFKAYKSLSGVSFKDAREVINTKSFAQWSKAGITLWNEGKFSHTYHEAFHDFTQLFLTPEQKKALYAEAETSEQGQKALRGLAKDLHLNVHDLNPQQKFFALEELLAEDFMNYMLSEKQLILNQRPKRNSFFRNLYDKIKAWFSGTYSIQQVYEKLANNNFKDLNRSLDNAFFGTLNKQIPGLDYTQSKDLLNAIDALIAQEVRNSNIPISDLFQKKGLIDKAYVSVFNKMDEAFDTTSEQYESLEDTPENQGKLSELQKTLDNLNFVFENWENIKEEHENQSKYLKISQSVREEEKSDDEDDIVAGEKYGEDLGDISARERASYQILYLIASLPKYTNKTLKYNDFLPIVPDVVDFDQAWNNIAKLTHNVYDYTQIYNNLLNLSKSQPSFQDLIKSLPHPTDKLNFSTNQLKNQFVNTFSQPLTPLKTVSFEKKKDGSLSVTMRNASSTTIKKQQQDWQLSLLENSKYMKGEQWENKTFDIAQFVEDFKNLKDATIDKKKDFLAQLGFELSEGALNSEELISFLKSNEFFQIFNSLKRYNNLKNDKYPYEEYIPTPFEKETFQRPIVSLFNTIYREIWPQNKDFFINKGLKLDKLSEGAKDAIDRLLEIELYYSDKYSTDNVLNSNGDNQYQIGRWDMMQVEYNTLNNSTLYPTYKDLIKSKVGQKFNTATNPDANNPILNSLFDLKTGERRTKNGKPITLELYNHDGVNISEETEQGATNQEGAKTLSLSKIDKLLQDISVYLTSGNKEHLRYASKQTSRGTTLTWFRFNGDTRDSFLPVATSNFGKVDNNPITLPEEAFLKILLPLKSAIILTNEFYSQGLRKDVANFSENVKYLGFLHGIISSSTLKTLEEQGLYDNKELDVDKLIRDNQKEIREDITKFFIQEVKDTKEAISNSNLSPTDYLDRNLLAKHDFDTVLRAFVVNSWIDNTSHLQTLFQDPRFYTTKKGFKELYKRIPKASGGGTIAINDEQSNAYINEIGRPERETYIKANPEAKVRTIDNSIVPSVIFNDIMLKPTQFVKELLEVFKSESPKEKKAIEKAYGEITTTDAVGGCTFDFYRIYQNKTGNEIWTPEHDRIAVKIMKEEELTKKEKVSAALFFPPIKIRQAGFTTDKNGLIIPIDYKFAVSPLLGTAIQGKSFQSVRDNMLRQGVDLFLFNSGSKHSAITKDNTYNNFYNEDNSVNTGDYTINPILWEHMFEQQVSPSKFKGKVRFSTQLRKLLFLNHFNAGVPKDFRPFKGQENADTKNREMWDSLPQQEKLKASKIYSNFNRFGDIIQDKINQEKDRLISSLSTDGVIDTKKLSEFLEKEFEERGLPDNVLKSIQVDPSNSFRYPLDASIAARTIESVILSVIDNRLRKQDSYGEALIQASAIGHEPLSLKRVDDFKGNGGLDLPFYNNHGRKLKDGTLVTSAQKVKIAIQGSFKLLLDHPDVLELAGKEGITPLQALNQLIKQESWLDKENNREMVSISSGVRIPTQGHNSMEFMEVYEFLPEEAANIIIVSPALVAKSGSDFDWDKLTSLFPQIYLNEKGHPAPYKALNDTSLSLLYNELAPELKAYLKALKDAKADEDKERASTDTFLASKKLVSSIFGDDNSSVQQLIKDTFGTSSIPSEESFKRLFNQKAQHNELISIVRRILQDADNYKQLVTPNDTFIFKPDADAIKKAEGKSKDYFGAVPTPLESARQHEANAVGKQSLGIGAIFNTLFSSLQSAGAYLNYEYVKDYINSPDSVRKTRSRLKPQEISIQGKSHVSLSSIFDKNGAYRISDLISQLMNGWVDVEKDDWAFYINARKEIAPTMLTAIMQGVSDDYIKAFFNQPILKEYVQKLSSNRSLFNKLKDKDAYRGAKNKAIHDVLSKYLPKELGDKLTEKYKQNPGFFLHYIFDSKKGLVAEADKHPEFFKLQSFQDFAIPKDNSFKALTPEDYFQQALLFVHFLELEDQAGLISNLNKILNADRSKITSFQDAADKIVQLQNFKKHKLIPDEVINRLSKESVIKGFTDPELGIHKFIESFSSNFFEVTNHPIFNKFLKDEWDKPTNDREIKEQGQTVGYKLGNNIPFEIRNDIRESWLRTIKNDLISYLYQNYVFQPNTFTKVLDSVKQQMRYDTSLASELESIKRNYKNLLIDNTLLQYLVRDNSFKKDSQNKPALVNIKLRSSNIDSQTSNILTQDFNKLLHFQDPDYTPEQQLEIQQFAQKLAHFSFIQSGLNKTFISWANIIPQEAYANDISAIILQFKKIMDTQPAIANQALKRFYDLFKKNNKQFFVAQDIIDEETGRETKDIDFNSETSRLKDYNDAFVTEMLGKKAAEKAHKEQLFIDSLKTKLVSVPYTAKTASENPKILIIFENNLQDSGLAGSAIVATDQSKPNTRNPAPNTIGIPLYDNFGKLWTDKTLSRNEETINKVIQNIIEKAKNYQNIAFPPNLTQVSQLAEKAPQTYNLLRDALIKNFNFELPNITISLPEEIVKNTEELPESAQEQLPLRNKTEDLEKGDAQQLGGGNTERIRKEYPKEIKLLNSKVSSDFLLKLSKIKEFSGEDVLPSTYFTENDQLVKEYGYAIQRYSDETNSEVTKQEAEFFRDNKEFADTFVDDYLSDERADGLTMQEYAQLVLDENVKLIDTNQLSLFKEEEKGSCEDPL